jgi:D-serine dehydratase
MEVLGSFRIRIQCGEYAGDMIASETAYLGTANKGLGPLTIPLPLEEAAKLNWNLLREDLSLPTAVLYEHKLQHNLRWMQRFIETYGAKLCPHGKTTMAPKLFARQLEAGAWGITLASAQQTRAAYEHGVRRVLMANQLVGKQNMATIARMLEDPEFEYYCLVDSPSQVEQLARFFGAQGGRRLNVLVEVGTHGGRAGVRDEQQLQTLAQELSRWRGQIALCGVEVFEGVLKEEEAIRTLLRRVVTAAKLLADGGHFDRETILLTGAGSAWYDVVAEEFSQAKIGYPVEVVLRPGCYLTHDAGIYREAQAQILKRNRVAAHMHSGLVTALQLWAYVQSIPEPDLAIIGLGKRDAAFDAGLPEPARHYRPGNAAPADAPATWKLTKMMDQHAYMQITAGDDLRPGDLIGLEISHPCLTFDKWRYLPVLDENYTVTDIVETFF